MTLVIPEIFLQMFLNGWEVFLRSVCAAIMLVGILGLQSCGESQMEDATFNWPVAAYRFNSYGSDFVSVDTTTLENVTTQIGAESRDGVHLTQLTNPLDLVRRQLIVTFFDISDLGGFLACKFDGGITWSRADVKAQIRQVRLISNDSVSVLKWEMRGPELISSSVALGYSGSADTVCRWSLDNSGEPIPTKAIEFFTLDNAQLTDGIRLGGGLPLTGWRSHEVVIPTHFVQHLDRIRTARHILNTFQNDMAFALGTSCPGDAVLDGSKLTNGAVREWSSQYAVGRLLPQFNIFSEQITFQQFKDPAIISESQVIRAESGDYDLGEIEVRFVMIEDVSNH